MCLAIFLQNRVIKGFFCPQLGSCNRKFDSLFANSLCDAAHQPFHCRIRIKYLDDRKNFFCSLTEATASDNPFWDRKRNSWEIMGILCQMLLEEHYLRKFVISTTLCINLLSKVFVDWNSSWPLNLTYLWTVSVFTCSDEYMWWFVVQVCP